MDFVPKIKGDEQQTANDGGFAHFHASGDRGLNSFAEQYPSTPTPNPSAAFLVASEPAPSPAELWTQRLFLLVYVVFCIWIGMLLAVLPWTPAWTQNGLLLRFPSVRSFLGMDFVRGVASGIGLIDVWIGIWEAVHYREPRRHKQVLPQPELPRQR